jgi:hypothetical protein
MNEVTLSSALETYSSRKTNKRKDHHLEGFEKIFQQAFGECYDTILKDKKIQESAYRSKKWDYSLYNNNELEAVIELKTLHKSANKNINNRMEEAAGSAALLRQSLKGVKTAYLIIGDTLDKCVEQRWKLFLEDLRSNGSYDGVCGVFLSKDGTYHSPPGLAIEDLINSLT